MTPGSQGGASDAELELAGQVLDWLFILVKTIATYHPTHPLTGQTAHALAVEVERSGLPCTVQIVADGAFRDRQLIPMDLERFQRVRGLGLALGRLHVHELSFHRVPDVAALIDLAWVLSRAAAGEHGIDLDHLRVDGVSWREIPHATRGLDSEEIDPEVFAVTQVTLAIADTELLAEARASGAPWQWSRGLAVARRLERAVSKQRVAAERTMESAPGAWTPSRRAASASLSALSILHVVGTSQATERAGAHAALALALEGYRTEGGRPILDASLGLMPRLLAAPVSARTGIEPHRLRVTALVHSITSRELERSGWPMLHAVFLAYEVERLRTAEGLPFSLARADLLAQVAAESGRRYHPGWVRLMISEAGCVPPGATVRLPDGRIGVAMGPSPSGDPWRPMVFTGGQLVVPWAPVMLVSAASVAGPR